MVKKRGVRKIFKIFLFMSIFLLLFQASGFGANMTHQQFATWLVKQVEAEGFLPAAAVTQDYFNFLRRVGIEPPGGWEYGKILTAADLEAILGLEPNSGYTFEKLIKMVEDMVREVLLAVPSEHVISPVIPIDPSAPPISPIVRPLTSGTVK